MAAMADEGSYAERIREAKKLERAADKATLDEEKFKAKAEEFYEVNKDADKNPGRVGTCRRYH